MVKRQQGAQHGRQTVEQDIRSTDRAQRNGGAACRHSAIQRIFAHVEIKETPNRSTVAKVKHRLEHTWEVIARKPRTTT